MRLEQEKAGREPQDGKEKGRAGREEREAMVESIDGWREDMLDKLN